MRAYALEIKKVFAHNISDMLFYLCKAICIHVFNEQYRCFLYLYFCYLNFTEVFMKKSKIFAIVSALLLTSGTLVACGDNAGGDDEELTGTALAVSKASKMTLEELEQASREEVEAQPGQQFKVVGLTSVLKSVAKTVAGKYDWLKYTEGKEEGDNINVNNGYKDYQLLTALDTAERQYFADYALAQDARSFSDYLEDGILFNYVPSDVDALGLPEEGKTPLFGVHFNKLFWTNSNFTHITGKTLHNIWQLAGTDADPEHLDKLSFQKPDTEQINMSFLVSAYAEENQDRILKAYKSYYGKDWEQSGDYQNAGQQWVAELIKNVTRWHTSDGTAMKETQLKDDWNAGYVYYGAFAKMKDAVGKFYAIEGQDTDPILKDLVIKEGENAGKICAMDTVKWDWEIEGFNGFMYCMDSQIINNAKFPYTACLFARTMLEQETYTTAIYNSKNPDAQGNPANQYGYYYPGKADSTFRYAKGDWTKETHMEKELNENYEYLKNVRKSTINAILTMVSSNKA